MEKIKWAEEDFNMALKDSKNKTIGGGDRVIIISGKLKGKRGYVYQIIDEEIRVTKTKQTGLIGWFKGNELLILSNKN